MKNKKEVVKSVVHAALEYGCCEFMMNVADATMPFRVNGIKKLAVRASAGLFGMYLGSWTADNVVSDAEGAMKDIFESERSVNG